MNNNKNYSKFVVRKMDPAYINAKTNIFTNGKMVIAVTTFNGKTVKGIAKCSDQDTFDFEIGKKLAIARCNFKVAQLRQDAAMKKYCEACSFAESSQLKLISRIKNAEEFVDDAEVLYDYAYKNLNSINKDLGIDE